MKKIAMITFLAAAMVFLFSACGSPSHQPSSTPKRNGSSNIGAGGYEMPNQNDKSFSDYVKRVDPDLYDELFSRYYG